MTPHIGRNLGRPSVVAALFVAAWLVSQTTAPAAPPTIPDFETIPFSLADWSGEPAPPLDAETLAALNADQYVHRYYSDSAAPVSAEATAGIPVEMDIAYYGQPRVGSNMHSPLNCLPGTGWSVTDVRVVEVASMAGTWPVRQMIVSRDDARFAMTYWYQSRQRIIGEELKARLHLLGDAIRRRPTDAGVVRLLMPVEGDPSPHHATMARFASALMPEIARRLR
jgi:EpsI family protein